MTVPALSIPLTGRHLIEASAGTGKTWTLTGILLRLLLESPYRPAEIAAATFTRKAAAEMRSRTQERFHAFLTLARAISNAYKEEPALLTDDSGLTTRLAEKLAYWTQHASETLADAAEDPINRSIIQNAASQGLDSLIALFARTAQRREDIDRLFIGTLDSLCQRLLQEFALETGSGQHIELLEDASEPVQQLVHRYLRNRLHHLTDPELSAFITSRTPFSSFTAAAEKALNFPEAPLENLPAPDPTAYTQLDTELSAASQTLQSSIDALAAAAASLTDASLDSWRNAAACLPETIFLANKYAYLHDKLLPVLNNAIARLRSRSLQDLQGKSTPLATFLNNLASNKIFKKNQGSELLEHPATAALLALGESIAVYKTALKAQKNCADALETYRAELTAALMHDIHHNLSRELPRYLEENAQSTFSEQTAKLNRALRGKGGAALSHAIARRIPALLIDESQDLNGAQAAFLEKIYQLENPDAGADNFLLLVGDPKQAIYQFRGGDTANYQHLKKYIPNRCTLSANFRTSAPLLNALNHLYSADSSLGEGIAYQPMNAGNSKPRILVQADGNPIESPVQWFDSTADNETLLIAQIIAALTSPYALYGKQSKHGITRLNNSDILVVMRNKRSLYRLQQLLQRQHIPAEFAADENLFTGAAAQAIGILLQAMRHPQNTALQNRLLASIFFNYSRSSIAAFAAAGAEARFNPAILSQALNDAGALWNRRQLLPALQQFLTLPLDGISIWERLAQLPAHERERHLLDLRQIQRILAEHDTTILPDTLLRTWLQYLAEPPNASWAKSQPIPGTDAVRLMTIHAAKGLESPVVIAAGLGKLKADSSLLYVYHDEENHTRLSARPKDSERQKRLTQDQQDEAARLLYVALTRAADLLLIALRPEGGQTAHPPLIRLNAYQQLCTSSLHNKLPADPAAALISSRQLPAAIPDAPASAVLHPPLPQPRIRGWQKSSFTALAKNAGAHDTHPDLPSSILESQDLPAACPAESAASADEPYPLRFPKGSAAGSFLHELLEHLPSPPDVQTRLIARLAQKYRLDIAPDDSELQAWLNAILHSRLTSGTKLANIPASQRANEMSFLIASSDTAPLPIDAINQLFARWGHPLALQNQGQIIAFFRGEIDLCYSHQQRYYILDYKSNYLGSRPEDYSAAAMEEGMNAHHYWLQALIYQTTLHRWLQRRLSHSYQPKDHLGSPEYYFLRGCPLADSQGHLAIDIPLDILFEFDALLLQ